MSHHAIAETCFFVKPKQSSRKRKREHITDSLRAEVFRKRIHELEQEVDVVLSAENTALLEEIVDFIQKPADSGDSDRLQCGIIVSGNDTNIDRLYARVSKSLSEESQPYKMVDLFANECGNLKATMKKVVQSTISQGLPIRNKSRLQSHDPRYIEAWISHQPLIEDESVKIVLALHDIELFSSVVVNDLIEVLLAYSIDFRMLCNVSTSLNHLQDVFLSKTIRKLRVSRFVVDPDESTLDKIVTQQLINRQHGLRLGYSAYTSLWGDYQNANRSVDLFISALKYINMCHFYTHRLATVSDSQYDLDQDSCDIVRSLPSFKRFVDHTMASTDIEDLKTVRNALVNDADLKHLFHDCVAKIDEYKRRLGNALEVFFIIKDASKSSVKPKSRAELYRVLLDRGLKGSNASKELLLSIKVMRKESLLDIFTACVETLQDPAERQVFQEFADELNSISSMSESLSSGTPKSFEARRLALGWKDPRSVAQAEAKMKLKQLRSEHELRQENATRRTNASQRSVAETTKSQLTEKEKRFTELVDSLHAHVSSTFEGLVNHEHLIMHELFWFDLDRSHSAAFNPDIRLHLRSALSDHETFLGKTTIEPQTSALFRLFQDSGQLINLYDWFQAFRQTYTPSVDAQNAEHAAAEEEEDEEEDEEDEEGAKIEQALFVKSLAELKFLGLFKSTRRKTDHVQKTISIL